MRLSDCDDRLLGSLTAVDRRPSGELDDLQITARANEAGGRKKGKEMKRKKKGGVREHEVNRQKNVANMVKDGEKW